MGKIRNYYQKFANLWTSFPEMIKADQLLTKFDKNHKGVKVVVDEFGGFVGIIGAEAVLSVLAGWWKNKS